MFTRLLSNLLIDLSGILLRSDLGFKVIDKVISLPTVSLQFFYMSPILYTHGLRVSKSSSILTLRNKSEILLLKLSFEF